LFLGPVRGRDPSTEVLQGLIGDIDLERADRRPGLDGGAHGTPPLAPTPRDEPNARRPTQPTAVTRRARVHLANPAGGAGARQQRLHMARNPASWDQLSL